jgi:hypothetical protein
VNQHRDRSTRPAIRWPAQRLPRQSRRFPIHPLADTSAGGSNTIRCPNQSLTALKGVQDFDL